jgi:hypothetical protein
MKVASLPTESQPPQSPQYKTTRPNFLDHRTPTITTIDRMLLPPPTLHDQAAFPGPACSRRVPRSLTTAQRRPPERVPRLSARELYPNLNLWTSTSPPLHALMSPQRCPMLTVPPMSSRHASPYRARARRAVPDTPKPWVRRGVKVVTADTVHITIYFQTAPSALLRNNSSNNIPECVVLPLTAQRRVRLLTLRNDHLNTGIGVKSREMAALVNCASGDVWRCLRLRITATRRSAQLTIGGMVALVCDGDVRAVPMCACVAASTWTLTANMRECSMRPLQRTSRMTWSLKAILNGGPPRAA